MNCSTAQRLTVVAIMITTTTTMITAQIPQTRIFFFEQQHKNIDILFFALCKCQSRSALCISTNAKEWCGEKTICFFCSFTNPWSSGHSRSECRSWRISCDEINHEHKHNNKHNSHQDTNEQNLFLKKNSFVILWSWSMTRVCVCVCVPLYRAFFIAFAQDGADQ